jgi:cytochrome c553
MKNKTLIVAGAALLSMVSMSVSAGGDYAAGEKKAKEVCSACHGADGNSPSGAFPKLAGQWESYIAAALHQYKSGQRKNPIMAPQAANLSEQDVADVATFFSQQNAVLGTLPAN